MSPKMPLTQREALFHQPLREPINLKHPRSIVAYILMTLCELTFTCNNEGRIRQ